MAYIMSTVKPSEEGCVFCRILAEQNDEANFVLHRGAHAFVLLNAFPYNPGHLMVVPLRHTGDFSSLSDAEQLELARLLATSQAALDRCMSPQGFNVGMNLGRAAGAGITDHLHYHVVPRWSGDSNFMSVVADTKVISEGLAETWRRLKEAFAESVRSR